MLSVLIEGPLIAAPVQRTSAKGSTFVTAQMRCSADDGESVFVSLIAFQPEAAGALARLGAGDTVAVAGPAAISLREKNGEPRVGLKVTATRVMSAYDAGMRRRAASADREPHGFLAPAGTASPQHGRRAVVREASTRPVAMAGPGGDEPV